MAEAKSVTTVRDVTHTITEKVKETSIQLTLTVEEAARLRGYLGSDRRMPKEIVPIWRALVDAGVSKTYLKTYVLWREEK